MMSCLLTRGGFLSLIGAFQTLNSYILRAPFRKLEARRGHLHSGRWLPPGEAGFELIRHLSARKSPTAVILNSATNPTLRCSENKANADAAREEIACALAC
jgi:hypothetical protein